MTEMVVEYSWGTYHETATKIWITDYKADLYISK